MKDSLPWNHSLKNKKKTSESYFRVKLEKTKFWQDLQSSGVWEFWKLEMGVEIIFCIVWELKESENYPSTSFKKLWVVGGWVTLQILSGKEFHLLKLLHFDYIQN